MDPPIGPICFLSFCFSICLAFSLEDLICHYCVDVFFFTKNKKKNPNVFVFSSEKVRQVQDKLEEFIQALNQEK